MRGKEEEGTRSLGQVIAESSISSGDFGKRKTPVSGEVNTLKVVTAEENCVIMGASGLLKLEKFDQVKTQKYTEIRSEIVGTQVDAS
ncbi:hypothetical protein C5167_033226 [Papaver somniferum]|uniref:Uncharacterized protein n=1 Tax=Papaver somniferum TaxID=3469 RepID=A0A4Y7K9Q7_PAPSO|nr:hypothetical protein C5167_033226 [Papaver somniferum]